MDDSDRTHDEREEKLDVAELASRWIDGEAVASDHAEAAALDESSRRQLADQFLMDSLLQEVNIPSLAEIEARLGPVLAELNETSGAERAGISPGQRAAASSRLGRWMMSSLTLAASLAAAVFLTVIAIATAPSAEAAVELAMQQATRPVDRHYRIMLELPAVKESQAELYLRGDDRFALHLHGPLNLSAWVGSTGDEAWIAPRFGPVIVAHDFATVQESIEAFTGLPVAFLSIRHVLEVLEKDYDLKLLDDQKVPGMGDKKYRHVRATTRSGFRPLLPKHVDFWSDPDNGIIGRLVLDWSDQVEQVAVRRLEFRLVDESTRDDSLYRHQSHHGSDRLMLRLGANARKLESTRP